MAEQKTNAPLVVFNGGEIGAETMDRVTLENYGACAEIQENMWLDANGPMGFRPGTIFKGVLTSGDAGYVRLHPFVRSIREKFLLALSAFQLRIISNDDVVARGSVSAAITNGTFASGLTGWTNISAAGSSAGTGTGRLLLNSDGSATAGVRQQVTTGSVNVMHAVDIDVHHGPVKLKIGTAAGGVDLIDEMELRTGYHSIAFTPTATDFFIDITSTLYRQVEVESIEIASAGDLVLDTPWSESDLFSLRLEESLNVMYVFLGTTRQKRIERWDNNSWSITDTDEKDGPFADANADTSITITPSVRIGNGTLTANKPIFSPKHVGALWKLVQSGQFETRTVNGADQWSDPVRVRGVGGSRALTATVSAGLTGTVRLQRSIGNTSSFADAATGSGTSGTVSASLSGNSVAFAFNDGLDNNDVYYRVGVKTGEYTSGSAVVTIAFSGASTEGVCRVTNYTDQYHVSMEVLANFATATSTNNWNEGAWSDKRGWPRAGNVFDGRLWTLRDDKFWGSYSEAYESHAHDEGASAAISRSVAVGQANTGQWIVGLSRLIIGTEGAEVVVRSNAFDEPLSTTNMTVREMSTYGVGDVQPIKVDTRCLYMDSSRHHMMEIVYNVQMQDYVARPLTTLHRDVGRPGVSQMAVMRRPDTRVFAVRDDGQLLVKLFDPQENILGWSRWITPGADGVIESVAVLPGGIVNQDDVYFSVKRTIGGVDYRYLEKLGNIYYTTASDLRPLDSCVSYTGAPATVFSGLSHLEGETVKVWADGGWAGKYEVTGGAITLESAASNVVAGLAYEAKYKGTKLAFGAKQGTALAQRGKPVKLNLILRKCYPGGIRYGQDFTTMHRLPDRTISDPNSQGPAMVSDTITDITMPGRIQPDPRVCIIMDAPGWINGLVVGEFMNERVT